MCLCRLWLKFDVTLVVCHVSMPPAQLTPYCTPHSLFAIRTTVKSLHLDQ
jgi:hypothetical protein